MKYILIVLMLLVAVVGHHVLVHGTLYDEVNLASHEAIAAFLGGVAVALTLRRNNK